MTALSFLLGALPLMLAPSAGAASQQAIGITVFGGMAFATIFGVILTPVLYVAVQAARECAKRQYGGNHPSPQPSHLPTAPGTKRDMPSH